MLRAGDLRNRITIQRQTEAKDEWGSLIPGSMAWVDVGQAWASIRNQSGMATIKADAQTSVVKASIRLRYRTDLSAGMRVLHGSTAYKVLAVLPDEGRRQHVDMVCEQVT